MAVTIHDSPQDFTPSDNPVTWTFSSDQTAQANFSYIVKVYIDGTLTANETIFPENGIYSRFDARDFTSNACSIPAISTSIVIDAANYCDVYIVVYERYGATPALQASATSATVTCWKAKMTDEDFVDWDYTNYAMNIYTVEDWLTNYPSTDFPLVKSTGESKFLMCINDGNNLDLTIDLYDNDDILIATDTYNFVAASEKLLICNLSPSVIVANTTINASDFSYAKYMIVSDTARLNDYQIDINWDTLYSTYKRIHFLSQWGGIESFSFGLISRISGKIKSYSYEKKWGEWNGSAFEYTKADGTTIDYAKRLIPMMKIESDWLTEAEQNYLVNNCVFSPLIYEESGSNLIKRKATNAKYEENIRENDQLFTLTLELALKEMDSMTI